MKKILILFLFINNIFADVLWDLPKSDFAKITGREYIQDLKVGSSGKISLEDAVFCTTKDNTLAIRGTTDIEEDGDGVIVMLTDNKVNLIVANIDDFVDTLIYYDAYARCDWWTADKGEDALIIDNINGKKKLTDLLKTTSQEKQIDKLLDLFY